jgi:hypothetical protein
MPATHKKTALTEADYDLSDWNPTTTKGKIFGPSILPGADWVTKKITGESSGSNWGGEEKPLTMAEAVRMIQEMKATPMTGSTKRMSGGSKGKAPKHWTPVDFNVLDKAQGQKPVPPPVGRALKEICQVCGIREGIHENQDHPMIPPMPSGFPPTQPSPQMPSPQPQEGLYGSLGAAAEPAFERRFGKKKPPPKQEGLYGDLGPAAEPAFDRMFGKSPPKQEQQNDNGSIEKPQYEFDRSHDIPPLPVGEQQSFPQPNGMMPSMAQEQGDDFPPDSQPPIYPPMPQEPMPEQMPPMPPAQVPLPMPNSPQEQMPTLPSPMPTAPQMQTQYTVSVPNSLSAQSIGGKKVNEMIREIESYIRK